MRDSQSFSQNISTMSESPDPGTQSSSKPAVSKQGTTEEEDIRLEDVSRILNEASQVKHGGTLFLQKLF